MSVFLAIAALLACLIGAALLLTPSRFEAPTGLRLT